MTFVVRQQLSSAQIKTVRENRYDCLTPPLSVITHFKACASRISIPTDAKRNTELERRMYELTVNLPP